MLLFPIVYGGFPKLRKQNSPPKLSTSSKTTNDPGIRLTQDNDCFTEVAEECDDVCDICRDVGPKAVKEVSLYFILLFYSVFHKSRQKEFCTDFNTVTVHRNRDLDHLGRTSLLLQGSPKFRTLSRTVLHSSSGSSRGRV